MTSSITLTRMLLHASLSCKHMIVAFPLYFDSFDCKIRHIDALTLGKVSNRFLQLQDQVYVILPYLTIWTGLSLIKLYLHNWNYRLLVLQFYTLLESYYLPESDLNARLFPNKSLPEVSIFSIAQESTCTSFLFSKGGSLYYRHLKATPFASPRLFSVS